MASLALGVAGAALGSAFGPLGASLGWTLGSALGNMLFPQKIEGPRLQDLHLHTSSYGKMTPILYGTMRIAGNVIWIGNGGQLVEHEETSGGKGGPEVTNFTYSSSFAVRICEGPIQGIRRIWANGRLIYSSDDPGDLPITVYLGTETQLPDPTMETDLGAGNVPGYRGLAYVVFTDLFLTDYGNAIPNLEFEAFTNGDTNIPIVEEYLTIDNVNNPGSTSPMVLTQWLLHGGAQAIRASGRITSTATRPSETPDGVNLWDSDPTLAYNGTADDFLPTDFWPQYIDTFGYDPTEITFGGEVTYYPLGILVNSDGTGIPLWAVNDGGSGAPVIAGPDLDCSTRPAFGTDYYQAWGLPSDHTFVTAVTTANNRSMFVFTKSPDASGQVDSWFQIRDNAIVRQGTVDSSLNIARDPLPTNRYGNTVARCFENNGQWMWTLQGNFGGLGHGEGGAVSLAHIDPATLVLSAVTDAGVCFLDSLSPTNVHADISTQTPSLIAIGSGRCGVIYGNAVAIFRRVSDADGVPLSEIVADLSDRTDFSDYDVSDLTDLVDGYLVTEQQSARDDIQPLRNAYFFDAVESDGVVKFVKRHADSAVTIDADDLAAHVDGDTVPPVVTTVRGQEDDLPAVVTVNYVNAAADYQTGSQTSQRLVTHSQSSVTIDLAISMSDQKAKSVADTQLMMTWVERNRHTAYTPRKYAKYEPTDVITADGIKFRVLEKNEVQAGVIKFDGVGALAPVLIQAGLPVAGQGGPGTTPQTPPVVGTTNLQLLDLPLISDTDDPNGLYVAMSGNSASWPGAALFKSTDGGASYSQVYSTSTPNVMGTTTDALGPWYGGDTFDELNTVSVVTTGGTLASATEDAVLGGANEGVIGSEIVQFKNATLTDTDTYALSGFLRGRRGTEWAMNGHGLTEKFVLLPVGRVSSAFSEINVARSYKPVTLGSTVAASTAQTFTNTGNALKPYAPVLLGGGSDGSGNVTLNCVRRTRIGGAWLASVDVPVSETSESYVWQIWNSDYSQVARIITTTSPTASYSSAQQVTDFGANQETVFFTVAQVGASGIGTQASGSVPGDGASNSDPLSAIPPYASPTSGGTTPPPTISMLTLSMPWDNVRFNSTSRGSFACGVAVVASFTTPSSTAANQIGWIAAAESTAGPVQRLACLSTVAGDFSGSVFGPSSVVRSTSPTMRFSVGTNTSGYFELATNTTYYFNVKNDDGFGVCSCHTSDCSIFVELFKPHGL